MKKYCERHDAYFDSNTGKWLDGKCIDKNCEFCKSRPKIHKSHKHKIVTGEIEWCR